MRGLIHLVDPSSFSAQDLLSANIDLQEPSKDLVSRLQTQRRGRPEFEMHDTSREEQKRFMNTLFYDPFVEKELLVQERQVARGLYKNASARDFFSYLHHGKGKSGEALWTLLTKEYLRTKEEEYKGRFVPLFIKIPDYGPDYITIAEAGGNLPAYKVLRETAFFSFNAGALKSGIVGGVLGVFPMIGIVDHINNTRWIDMYVWDAATAFAVVGLPGFGMMAGAACYKVFQNARIKRNSLRRARWRESGRRVYYAD